MTQGHNIVAYELPGAAHPHPHPTPYPTPFPTQTHTQKASKWSFSQFLTSADGRTNKRMDGPMDQRTDKASYRVTCPQLKMVKQWYPKVWWIIWFWQGSIFGLASIRMLSASCQNHTAAHKHTEIHKCNHTDSQTERDTQLNREREYYLNSFYMSNQNKVKDAKKKI